MFVSDDAIYLNDTFNTISSAPGWWSLSDSDYFPLVEYEFHHYS